VLFYGIGNLMRERIVLLFNKFAVKKIFLISFLLFLVTCIYKLNPTIPQFAINIIVSPITYIVGISGALMMCCIAVLFSKVNFIPMIYCKKIIVYMGMNSYIVLAFHQILLLLLGKYTTLSGYFVRCIMWVILILLIYITTNYIPWLLGRSKNKSSLQ
jgi:hypothetical protein